jgi:hypothetical protein
MSLKNIIILVGAAGAIVGGITASKMMKYKDFEDKFPSVKAMREAYENNMQIAFIHDSVGKVCAVPIKLVNGTEEVDLREVTEKFGIKFKPRNMNEAEFIDNKLAAFHYLGDIPNNISITGASALSKARRILEARGVNPTTEKLQALLEFDLSKPLSDIRKQFDMLKGLTDYEIQKLSTVQQELKAIKNHGCVGPFVFSDACDAINVARAGLAKLSEVELTKSCTIDTARSGLSRLGKFNPYKNIEYSTFRGI